eukprot:scaffold40069_cov74-Phaeocystis_antarctica.AAC.3
MQHPAANAVVALSHAASGSSVRLWTHSERYCANGRARPALHCLLLGDLTQSIHAKVVAANASSALSATSVEAVACAAAR